MTTHGDKSVQYELQTARLNKATCLQHKSEILNDFNKQSIRHGHHPLGDRPISIRHYRRNTYLLRGGIVAGAIMASVVFALLNAVSIDAPPLWIVLGSLAFAVLMGYVTNLVIGRWSKVDPLEPGSSTRADRLLVLSGTLAIASLAVFLFLRFSGSELARSALPTIAMIFELGVLCVIGSAIALLQLYDWGLHQANEFQHVQSEIAALDARIAICEALLIKEDGFYEDDKDDSDQLSVGPGDEHPNDKPRKKPNGSATGDDQRVA